MQSTISVFAKHCRHDTTHQTLLLIPTGD